MKPREERYLEKIKNDIDENLFDLLIMHLNELGSSIRLYDSYSVKLIELLNFAISNIKSRINDGNKFFMYRYILLCANKILLLDKNNSFAKNIKKEIIADYTHTDSIEGKIPLNEQFNSLYVCAFK